MTVLPSDDEILSALNVRADGVSETLMAQYRKWYAMRVSPSSFSKRCTKCGKKKKLTEYHLNTTNGGDGRRSDCKGCHSNHEARRQKEARRSAS